MATVTEPLEPAALRERPESLADLLRRLGNIPADRVRLHPPPGMATEEDVIRNNESLFRTAICELVDGTLVEKPEGWEESAIAILIARFLGNYVDPRRLGTVLGADGMLRLVPGLMHAAPRTFRSSPSAGSSATNKAGNAIPRRGSSSSCAPATCSTAAT